MKKNSQTPRSKEQRRQRKLSRRIYRSHKGDGPKAVARARRDARVARKHLHPASPGSTDFNDRYDALFSGIAGKQNAVARDDQLFRNHPGAPR